MSDKRVISTRLTVDGEAEYKRQMEAINREIRTQKSELGYLEAQYRGQANSMEALTEKDRVLRNEVEQQEEKVRALTQAVKDSAEAFGEQDAKTDKYRQSLFRAKKELIDMQEELRDTEKYLQEAADSADGTASSIDGFGNALKDAGDDAGGLGGGLEGVLGTLSNLKGVIAGGAVVGAIKEAGEAIIELEESTREYRQLMGQLEVSSRDAGYTAEQTSEVYMKLYGIIGESQATVEATTQLQAMKLTQEELNFVTDATIGAWTRLGGAAPIESIAEAVMQTMNAGTATGAFSDLLVAAGRSEDEFNAKMEACSTAAERQDVVLQELASMGLAEAAAGYYELNEDTIAANQSQANMEAALGRLGEVCAPIANQLRNLTATGINVLADAIDATIEKVTALREELREMGQSTEYANWSQYAVQDIKFHGSHADGLGFVPFNGYRAELHYGERVMTATENSALDTLERAVAALESSARGAAPATAAQNVSLPEAVTLTLRTDNGQFLGSWLVPYVRSENKSNPEAVSDPL